MASSRASSRGSARGVGFKGSASRASSRDSRRSAGESFKSEDIDWRWDHENTHILDRTLAESKVGRVFVVGKEVTTSVSEAVMMLQCGEIPDCVDGYCMCFSESKDNWFLIYRADKLAEAFGEFGMEWDELEMLCRWGDSDEDLMVESSAGEDVAAEAEAPERPGSSSVGAPAQETTVEGMTQSSKAPPGSRSATPSVERAQSSKAQPATRSATLSVERRLRSSDAKAPGTPRSMDARMNALKAKLGTGASATPPGTPRSESKAPGTPRGRPSTAWAAEESTQSEGSTKSTESTAPVRAPSVKSRVKAINEKLAKEEAKAAGPEPETPRSTPGTPRSMQSKVPPRQPSADTRMRAVSEKLAGIDTLKERLAGESMEAKAPGTPRSMDTRIEALKARLAARRENGTPPGSRRPSLDGRRPSVDDGSRERRPVREGSLAARLQERRASRDASRDRTDTGGSNG